MITHTRRTRRSAGWGWLLVLAAAVTFAPVHAQDPADGPTFEVATIRPNPSTETPVVAQQVRTQPNGRRLEATHVTARELIRYAYDYQYRPLSLVSGGPRWLDTERWDVVAQAEEPFQPVPRPGMLPPDAAAMLRTMLADRFQLRVRTDTREADAYALVLERSDGRLGPNLTPSEGTCQGSMSPPDPESPLPRCPFILGPRGDGTARFELGNITMDDLASMLGNFPEIDELVVDRTGLTGRYDMKVHFQGGVIRAANAPAVPRPVEATEVPLITGAIRQQLGLRLERQRMALEAIVIEQAERPSEN